jgi:pyruvate/2-oxoglutarate dehydrogenase complex dihydrolipoamide acyltransferase (E2) component
VARPRRNRPSRPRISSRRPLQRRPPPLLRRSARPTRFQDARSGAVPAMAPPTTQPPTLAPGVQAQGQMDANRVFASPLARRIAREGGVDLCTVKGSGPHGRVVERDVRAALDGVTAKPVKQHPHQVRRWPRGRPRPPLLRPLPTRPSSSFLRRDPMRRFPRHDAQGHRQASAGGQADHPAFLPDGGHQSRRLAGAARAESMRPRQRTRTASPPTRCPSTTSSSRRSPWR